MNPKTTLKKIIKPQEESKKRNSKEYRNNQKTITKVAIST